MAISAGFELPPTDANRAVRVRGCALLQTSKRRTCLLYLASFDTVNRIHILQFPREFFSCFRAFYDAKCPLNGASASTSRMRLIVENRRVCRYAGQGLKIVWSEPNGGIFALLIFQVSALRRLCMHRSEPFAPRLPLIARTLLRRLWAQAASAASLFVVIFILFTSRPCISRTARLT